MAYSENPKKDKMTIVSLMLIVVGVLMILVPRLGIYDDTSTEEEEKISCTQEPPQKLTEEPPQKLTEEQSQKLTEEQSQKLTEEQSQKLTEEQSQKLSEAQKLLEQYEHYDKEQRSEGKYKAKGETKNKKWSVSEPDGYINGHGYVDLGLPSGIKWAWNNVGSELPEDSGVRFAWGETQTKETFTAANCVPCGKNEKWLRRNGYIDASGNLTLSHDAANKNWGNGWRMPTKAEFEELLTCTFLSVSYRGRSGFLIVNETNGKVLFLPNSYSRSYWSATLCKNDPEFAYYLYRSYVSESYRDNGHFVRAVLD